MRHGPTGIEYASLFGVRESIRRHSYEPSWQGAYIYNLKHGDYDSAHLIRCLNDPDYEERCREETEQVFPVESAPLRSGAELESEREEELEVVR